MSAQQTDLQDLVITSYELDNLTYEEAVNQVKELSPDPMVMFFWLLELRSAQVLKEEDIYQPDQAIH